MRCLFTLSACLGQVVSASFNAEDFEVHGLGSVEKAFDDFDGRMYAGQLPTSRDVDKFEDSKFMFWLFEPDQASASDTLTLWFNGGPGCSSFQGALFENSPVTTPHYPAGYPKTTATEPLLTNEWAWTRATNMMYVEMPQGTGFSFGPTPTDEFDVAGDMHGFLLNFFDTFPEMNEKKVFLFGESYAGYYVPAIAHKIHIENKKASDKDKIQLAGIGLGNGWVEAETQAPAVIDFAWWHGMIDSTTRDSLHRVWKDCKSGKPMPPPFHAFTIPDECSIMGAVLAASGAGVFPAESFRSPNPYDVTTFDLYPVLFNDNSTYFQFYNNPKVQKALNAPEDSSWMGCMPGAGRRRVEEGSLPGQLLLAHDKPESVAPYIAELLDAGIRVLVYSGDRDMTTCAQGSEMVLDKMEWSGQNDWSTAERGLWMVNDEVAGYSKGLDGLQFVVVYNAGHLLPNNNPVQALDLITRFVTNTEFLDIPLPSFDVPETRETTSTPTPFNQPVSHIISLVVIAAGFFGLGYCAAVRQKDHKGYTHIS